MNTEYGTGDSHEVVYTNARGGGFVYFIGSKSECEHYMETHELPEDTEIYKR